MFVDASAIVAILTREPEAEIFEYALATADSPISSPLAVFEAVLALCRKTGTSLAASEQAVRSFLSASRVGSVAIGDEDSRAAVDACARYGKGRGHPAQLNMGDCFAYAAARTRGVPLLFKGHDFTRTDITQAVYRQ